MKLTIGYFYPNELNLYGDTGNIEILVYRAKARGIDVDVLNIDSFTVLDNSMMSNLDLVFMGGGPDSGQKDMYLDLLQQKGPYIKDYIENGGVALFICGSYQLLGHYYKSADGSVLGGLGIFDLYTQHFGNLKPRCVGNTVAKLNDSLLNDQTFKSVNKLGDFIVGFENHGGYSFLENDTTPLGTMFCGFGNNASDKTEGIHYKNSIGTYFHGPILSKNAHLSDYLIAKSLKLSSLETMDDYLVESAYKNILARFK